MLHQVFIFDVAVAVLTPSEQLPRAELVLLRSAHTQHTPQWQAAPTLGCDIREPAAKPPLRNVGTKVRSPVASETAARAECRAIDSSGLPPSPGMPLLPSGTVPDVGTALSVVDNACTDEASDGATANPYDFVAMAATDMALPSTDPQRVGWWQRVGHKWEQSRTKAVSFDDVKPQSPSMLPLQTNPPPIELGIERRSAGWTMMWTMWQRSMRHWCAGI